MDIKESNKAKLRNVGLKLNQDKYRFRIMKPDSVEGNSISLVHTPFEEVELTAFSPELVLEHYKNKWHVRHWEYIPGPGPGDFSLDFEHEDDAIDFIISYYFTDNKYFRAKKIHVLQERTGIDIDELASILEKGLNKLKELFSPDSFIPFETDYYAKISFENWKKLPPKTEPPNDEELDFGILFRDAYQLKNLISTNRNFEPADFEILSEIFRELSYITKKRISPPNKND